MFYSLFLGHIPGDLNKKKFKPGTDNIVIYNLIKAPKKKCKPVISILAYCVWVFLKLLWLLCHVMRVNILIWLNMLKAKVSITVAPSLVVISNRSMYKESTKQCCFIGSLHINTI
jgi:hypothetical protein